MLGGFSNLNPLDRSEPGTAVQEGSRALALPLLNSHAIN